MAKCPPGFKKKGTKCVRSTTYKSPLLRKKLAMESSAKAGKVGSKYGKLSADMEIAAVRKRKKRGG